MPDLDFTPEQRAAFGRMQSWGDSSRPLRDSASSWLRSLTLPRFSLPTSAQRPTPQPTEQPSWLQRLYSSGTPTQPLSQLLRLVAATGVADQLGNQLAGKTINSLQDVPTPLLLGGLGVGSLLPGLAATPFGAAGGMMNAPSGYKLRGAARGLTTALGVGSGIGAGGLLGMYHGGKYGGGTLGSSLLGGLLGAGAGGLGGYGISRLLLGRPSWEKEQKKQSNFYLQGSTYMPLNQSLFEECQQLCKQAQDNSIPLLNPLQGPRPPLLNPIQALGHRLRLPSEVTSIQPRLPAYARPATGQFIGMPTQQYPAVAHQGIVGK